MCQARSLCFGRYILPFVIVFGILALFLVTAIGIVIVHKVRKGSKRASRGPNEEVRSARV